MKKIEESFVKEFNKSLDNQKNFEDIKTKINIERFNNKTSSHAPLNKLLSLIATFVLVIVITVPSAIFIWNANNIVDPGLGGNPSIDIPALGENPSTGDDPSTGDNSSEGDKDNIIRTILNSFGAPSLPHYVSAETAKYHSVTDELIDVNVYLGHPNFNMFNDIPFSDFVLSKEDLENYAFSIVVNYNNEQTAKVLDDVDYINSAYNITTSDLYEDDIYMGSIVHYRKYHTIGLEAQLLKDKNHGFVDIQLILKSLQDDSEIIVMNTTLYYSVTPEQIIFGLSENPALHEGESGAITCGWEYRG